MIPPRFYVTGTDTDVGKTVASAVLCRALGCDYWKPVQSGLAGETDAQTVVRLSGAHAWPEAYALPRPASPHASARDAGARIQLDAIHLPPADRLLVEGAGGWMVPYATEPTLWQSDVVKHLGLSVVIVARTGLGTLNHTLSTLRAVRGDGVEVIGLLLVGDPHPENESDLALLGQVRVIGRIPRMVDVAAELDAVASALRPNLG